MTPFFSIIMPAFNAELTIADSIRSVLQQTFSDWELLIVDDASRDNTKNVVAGFIEKEPGRIRYLYNSSDEHGPSVCRNMGIDTAKGEWIMFLDADDLYLPDRLETYYRQISRISGPAAIHSDYYYYVNGKRKQRLISYFGEPSRYKEGDLFRKGQILERCAIGILTVAVHRSVLAKTGLFDTALKGTEDYDLWIRISAAGYTWHYINSRLALYTINPNGLSKNMLSYARALLGIYHKYKEYYRKDSWLENAFMAKYARWKANMFYDRKDYQRARSYFIISLKYDKLSYRKLTGWIYLLLIKLKGKTAR